jgi:purine-binding chemotaxis protein CheW
MPEAEPSSAPTDGDRRFLTFLLNDGLYALPAGEVAEVIRTPAVARMPQAPSALIGIANLRGSVLPLVSLRSLLGQKETRGEGPRSIVLGGKSPAALAVDAVEALVTVAAKRVETRQAELAANPGEQIVGAFHIEGRGAAKILDVHALLDRAFAQRGERKRQGLARTATPGRRSTIVANSESDTLVTFDVANQEYALALSVVREIVPAPQNVTQTPRAEALAIGMVAYRDQLLPLFSLRGLLGFAPAALSDAREKVVVTAVRGVIVGLVVDQARAIISAERRLTEPVPAMLAARAGGETRLKAVYRGEQGRRLISILAPDQLFREDVMQRLGSAEDVSMPKPAAPAKLESQFLVFRLGDGEFGLPIAAVDEVTRVPDHITRIPRAPKFLEGVINLRGEVLPVVDQRRRFDMPRLEVTEGRRMIVVRTDRYRAGLIVDSVSEVRRHPTDAIEPPPVLTDDITRAVQGVVNLVEQGRIVLLLDPAALAPRPLAEAAKGEPEARRHCRGRVGDRALRRAAPGVLRDLINSYPRRHRPGKLRRRNYSAVPPEPEPRLPVTVGSVVA